MYAALAAVLVAGLCWDFGRRWLVMRERAEEAALIRTAEMNTVWSEELSKVRDQLNARCDDLGTTLNARVRELGELLQSLADRIDVLDSQWDAASAATDKAVRELQQRPTQAPDMKAHDAAVKNLAQQLGELSAHVTEELKKVRASQAGAVVRGTRRLVT